jgi:pyrimidine-specific ribonucleoside hydrolase
VTDALPILIDCDPGHDDALAILLALAHPELDVRAVTTVGGNAPLERTTDNALRVLTLIGCTDVPVAAGASRPLAGPLHTAPHVHGASGIDGAELPEPEFTVQDVDAVQLMVDRLASAPAPSVIVATGPLTNVALLLDRHPELRERIARIVFMGGSIGEGNITASAEFNVWADPEAARLVVRAGLPTTMIGLDVTHQALITAEEVERLARDGGRVSTVMADLLRFFGRFHDDVYGWGGMPIHDAVAVAHLLRPDLVETARYHVDVEVAGELTRGRTVVDTRGHVGEPANLDVGVHIDRERFRDLLFDAVRAFD